MLEIISHILAVIGIILLALLAFFLIVTATVLFFPITYRIYGEKEEGGLTTAAKAEWLFGLVRASYRYPEPGRVRVKVLMFTVYDSKVPSEKKQGRKSEEKTKSKRKKQRDGKGMERAADAAGESTGGESGAEEAFSRSREMSDGMEMSDGRETQNENESSGGEKKAKGEELPDEGKAADDKENHAQSSEAEDVKPFGMISQKIEKIKYTIRSIYDKIKGIWGNISYYIELLREEDTKQLISYTAGKLAVILRHLRPKRVKADVLFGTGSPDTTGYAYGAYCMLSAAWGGGIVVTPDFERQICKARFDAKGHITIWVLTVNVLKVVLDKRLQVFIAKLKAGKKGSSSK